MIGVLLGSALASSPSQSQQKDSSTSDKSNNQQQAPKTAPGTELISKSAKLPLRNGQLWDTYEKEAVRTDVQNSGNNNYGQNENVDVQRTEGAIYSKRYKMRKEGELPIAEKWTEQKKMALWEGINEYTDSYGKINWDAVAKNVQPHFQSQDSINLPSLKRSCILQYYAIKKQYAKIPWSEEENTKVWNEVERMRAPSANGVYKVHVKNEFAKHFFGRSSEEVDRHYNEALRR